MTCPIEFNAKSINKFSQTRVAIKSSSAARFLKARKVRKKKERETYAKQAVT